MGGGGGGGGKELQLSDTPTWAVASVCGVIILISLLLEHGLHHMGEFLAKRKKKHLGEALEKIKAELMILGFISLLLTFGQNYITQICISEKAAKTLLPCKHGHKMIGAESEGGTDGHGEPSEPNVSSEGHHRRLLSQMIMDLTSNRRVLSAGGGDTSCDPGKVPLVSAGALHQLHIFIFFLAVFHVLSCGFTMALGRAKIREWKEWEKETSSPDSEFADDRRFRFVHETSFVKQHASFWNKMKVSFYFVSFFRQFFRSVRKVDYLSMRHGFVSVHIAPGSKFNFQKYIKRSLEDDFKVVVGISPVLWLSAVIFMLLNVGGWHTLLWISVMPMILILAVGTKLQAIITKMALEIQERHAVVQGMPVVQLTNRHFWFDRPEMVLFFIHFTLFQNAFQLIYILWIWYEFGWDSCFHDSMPLLYARVCLGIGVQFLCSYITLPLYALVSQMGAQLKKSIFDEHTGKALHKWHQAAKKNVKETTDPPVKAPDAPLALGGPHRRRKSMEQELPVVEPGIQNSSLHDDLMTGSEPEPNTGQGNDYDYYLVKL